MWVGRVVVLAAAWSFIAIPLHVFAPVYVKRVDQAFDFFGIPAGHTFFSAVYLAVVGSALLRGKRAALLWVLWVFEANAAGRAFYAQLGFAPDGARQARGEASPPEIRLRARLD